MPPTPGQLILLAVAVLLLALGSVLAVIRQRRESEPTPQEKPGDGRWRIASKACLWLGVFCSVGVIAWHAVERGQWRPMADNFEALLWLGTLLAAFVMYIQAVKHIRGLDLLLMPVAILLLIAAAVFGLWEPHDYKSIGADAWIWVHHVSSYVGALAFAVAAGAGAMYVIASRRLRRKQLGPSTGSLESLERLMMASVTLGFALLTIGLITGVLRLADDRPGFGTSRSKAVLASLAWLVYAVVMHAPINPRFRGRRAALLSVFGFVLVAGSLVAVMFMAGGQS
jgi:ABC-type uncharacterized transport system permease subunit